MAILSISEAARTWGVGRSTLQRAIKEGRLSITSQPDGNKGIDTAELHRIFGETRSTAGGDTGGAIGKARDDTASTRSEAPAPLQTDTALLINALQAQITLLQASLTEAKEREKWLQARVEALEQRLLPAPQKPWLERLAEALAKLRKPQG